jgi:choice-of-anchor A domain-containing protein
MKPPIHVTAAHRFLVIASISAAAVLFSITADSSMIGPVDLGGAGDFALLALTGSIDDSGPAGPDSDPYTVDGRVGVVTPGQKFQASGSVAYNGPIYLHSGVTFNNSAPGVPPPTIGPAIDSVLEQARNDAFLASNFALTLPVTASYGSISNNLTISKASVGNYVFSIQNINFSGGKALTLHAPAGSAFILNISSGLTLSPGSIVLSGGLTANSVLINYTGTSDISTSGGGNASRIYATILAPNATVGLHPGFVAGSIIAGAITMSSGANVVPIPEVTPGSVIFGFLGFVVAFSSRRMLMARVRAVSEQRKPRSR